MLNYILWGLGIIIGLIVLVFVLLLWMMHRNSVKQERRIGALLDPVAVALTSGRQPDQNLLMQLAAQALTRRALYELLMTHKRIDLFPREFENREAMAESDLARWLSHGNELGAAPDEMKLMKVVPMEVGGTIGQGEWYLFKFRTKEPHWAADREWMTGIAGPYPPGDDIPPAAKGSFSELESIDEKSADEHVKYLHGLVSSRSEW